MKENLIRDKSFVFAVKVVRLCQFLMKEKAEFVLSKQLLRSGTSIGANVREAVHAQSKRDFLSKMNIALKEAGETQYWLELLTATKFVDDVEIKNNCDELCKILSAIVRSSKDGEVRSHNY